jgi:hypothetical protein
MTEPIGPDEMTHLLDQMIAALDNMAKVLWDYKVALIREGFTEDQAMAMVIQYQATFLSSRH